tara:strand:+ start:4709 stop:5167 length:459 start_codon:yes stop_codon:yes gene_type:complete
MILGDTEFQQAYQPIFDLDWTGYDLYLVGSLTNAESSNDIDAIIVGPYDPPKVLELLKGVEQCGPWDIAYYGEVYQPYQMGDPARMVPLGKSKDSRKPGKGNPKKSSNGTRGVWQEGIYWLHWELPCAKRIANPERYADDIQLIQNGQQLYF